MIALPLALFDDADLTLFASVSSLEDYVEWQDVEADAYRVWDATGQSLKLQLVIDSTGLNRVSVRETNTWDADAFRASLQRTVALLAKPGPLATLYDDFESTALASVLSALSPYLLFR